MKNYEELIDDYRLVIWDGESNVRCNTGIFTSEEIKQHWKIGNGAETFMIIKGKKRTIPTIFGTDLASPYDTEDVVECGKFQIKDVVEDEMRQSLTEDEVFVECDMDMIDELLLVVDQRS